MNQIQEDNQIYHLTTLITSKFDISSGELSGLDSMKHSETVPNDCRVDTPVTENPSGLGASVYSNGDTGAAIIIDNPLKPAHKDEIMETKRNVTLTKYTVTSWYYVCLL